MDLEIVCADLASIGGKRSAWAWRSPQGRVERHPQRADIAALSRVLADALRTNRPIVLGVECPLSVPIPTNEAALGRGRTGEDDPPWASGAGAAALATGFVQLVWVFRAIRERAPGAVFFTDWHAFEVAGRGLFVWEAHVPVSGRDPEAAIRAFTDALPDPTRSRAVAAPRPFSLAGAAALWAGLTSDPAALHDPVLAIRA